MTRLDARMRALTAAATAVLAASGSVSAAPPPPPPASGHAAVVAQAGIEFNDGSYQWSVSGEVYDAGAPPSPAVDGSDTFFAVTAGALLAAEGETPIARIAAGEAMFVRKDATTTVTPTDGAVANFYRIAVVAGGVGGTGAPFTPGPGVRDVDLVRDVLDPGGTLAIADSDAAPTLVVVVTGTVTVAGDPVGSADVTAAAPATFDGNLTLVNGGTEPAVVLVAVVGTPVQTTAAAATTTTIPNATSFETFPPVDTEAPGGDSGPGGLGLPDGPDGPGEDRDRDIYTPLREGQCERAAENLDGHWDDVRSPRDVLLYQAAIELCRGDRASASEWLAATNDLGLDGLAVPVETRNREGDHILFAYYCEVYRSVRGVLEGQSRDVFQCPGGVPPAWPPGERDDPRTPEDEATTTIESDGTTPPTHPSPTESSAAGPTAPDPTAAPDTAPSDTAPPDTATVGSG